MHGTLPYLLHSFCWVSIIITGACLAGIGLVVKLYCSRAQCHVQLFCYFSSSAFVVLRIKQKISCNQWQACIWFYYIIITFGVPSWVGLTSLTGIPLQLLYEELARDDSFSDASKREYSEMPTELKDVVSAFLGSLHPHSLVSLGASECSWLL